MDFEISTPWGTINSKCDTFATATIFQGLKQLNNYWKNGNNSDHLKRDIQGYKILLESAKQEENCDKFLELKHQALRNGNRYPDNLAVINFMRENDLFIGEFPDENN